YGSLCPASVRVLAGCATRWETPPYSSLPPSPAHPGEKPAVDRETVVIPGPGTPGAEHVLQHLPPEQYADILDRIREGYGLEHVESFAIDRELEHYRDNPEFLDRTFNRGSTSRSITV